MIVKEGTENMFHHIDYGYSMVTPNYKPAYIDRYKITVDGTIDEVDNTFWFEEDEDGGIGGVQFYGVCFARNTEDRPDYVDSGDYGFNHSDFIKFRWWFNVTLLGDPDDETKIYLDIDTGLIESDLFEYEVEMDETNVSQEEAEDFIEKNAYELGEFIWNVIKNNATGFGYAKSNW